MDDDEFEDYVGTQEVIEEIKQEGEGQKQQHVVQEIIVDSVGNHQGNDINEVADNENNQTPQAVQKDLIIRVDLKEQTTSTHGKSQPTNSHKKPLQNHHQCQPQQTKHFTNEELSIESDLIPIETIKTETAPTAIELYEQTVFQNIQEKPVEEFASSSPNQIQIQKIEVHSILISEKILLNDDQGLINNQTIVNDGPMIDANNLVIDANNLMNEPANNLMIDANRIEQSEPANQPINQFEHTLNSEASDINMNQKLAAIQFQNPLHEQKLYSNPDLNSDVINFNPTNNLNQNLSIEPNEWSSSQHHEIHSNFSPLQQQNRLESSLTQQKNVQNDEIPNDYQAYHQNDLIQNYHLQTNQVDNELTNENQVQQEQDDEFGDFETYQQSTNQIPIAQITPQQNQPASNQPHYQSYPPDLQNDQQNLADNQMTLSIHHHQTQSLSQQNQLPNKQNTSEPQQIQQIETHSQIPKETENFEPNQQFSPVKSQQNQTSQPKIEQIVPKQLTLQDELAAFINSLPNYKRICQKVFYNPA